jgi:hypothetical protein
MRRLSVVFAMALLAMSAIPVQATSTTDAEHLILDWINQARNERGLDDLRAGHRLWDIAAYRADRMADTNRLSHSIAGKIGSQLNARNVPWYAYGEDIGYSPQRSVTKAAAELFKLWKASPSHWELMMSSRYNYIGVGLDYRSSNHRWFSSLIFTESPDLTGARAAMIGGDRNGDDVVWQWRGFDPQLQSHTAGLDDFDVQLRTDSGSWKTISSGTTSTARTVKDLAGGHWYGLRVRATDQRGNTGPFASEIRIWVP